VYQEGYAKGRRKGMKQLRKCRIFLAASIAACFLACLAVCFSETVSEISREKGNDIPVYIVGGVFWAGLLFTYIFTGAAAVYRRRDLDAEKSGRYIGKPGFLCFFQNLEAKIMDVLMIVSVLALATEIALDVHNSVFALGTIFLTIFSVHMHGILNGKNYRYIKEN